MTETKHQNKITSLDQAIRSNSGQSYDEEGRNRIDPDKIIKAAKKFEAYLKGKSK